MIEALRPATCRTGHSHTDAGAARTCDALLELPRPLQAAWCDGYAGTYEDEPCGLPEGHAGPCDPDVDHVHDNGDYRA